MERSTDRILTTHAGSLPRPDDLGRLMFDVVEEKKVNQGQLEQRVSEAVKEVVTRQRETGIDIISDGEMGKVGFSNYVLQRFTGFAGTTQLMAADLADVPEMATQALGPDAGQHLRLPILEGPIEPREGDAIQQEIEDLTTALGDTSPGNAFICAISPGHVAFNFPNRHYPSHESYIEAAAEALKHEYEAIVRAGFDLQVDAPDVAMACHCMLDGSDPPDPQSHVAAGMRALNAALADLPADKVRLHVCFGNYGGPHHKDVELKEIIEPILQTRAGFISLEAANPRHEHEWQVWEQVELPDDKALIAGVIDVKTNHVEHPLLVAQRIERFARILGKERVIAGTDCGFETFVGMNSCHPRVAWLKLDALAQGAMIASKTLW